ncbi:MAG TPA: hypothetical protein VNE38_06720 [Ktedonobacteraceae bacterium]|nr:hypothetical protein [Ktedonobacteraceae bacterium]
MPQTEMHLPFALLADIEGKVIACYTSWDDTARACRPGIVLADRYNALYEQWVADQETGLPSIEELLASLRYLNKLCTP